MITSTEDRLDAARANRRPSAASVTVATVVITTRDRKHDICRAIESVLCQSLSTEILVMDDASSDGTADLIAERYPGVRVVRSDRCFGLIVQRNKAATLAHGVYLFSLDDDAVFTEPDILERVVTLFDDPRVGAVAMPIVNIIGGQRISPGVHAPTSGSAWIVSTYIGAAHAVRRDLFVALGGYEESLFQWGEETNYCQKLYASGHVVRIADCGVTEHYPNPVGRHQRSKNVWIYRNAILNIWFYAPWWLVPALWAIETSRWLVYGVIHPKSLPVVVEGLVRGILWALWHPSSRKPMPYASYALYMKLRAAKVTALEEIESQLPPLWTPTGRPETTQ